MYDVNKYHEIYQEMKKLGPDDIFQIITNADNKEEQNFFAMVGNFFLQQKQKELVSKNVY